MVNSISLQATHYALIAGHGDAPTLLNAFDRALQSAGVGNYNLVKVTSILPPNAHLGDFSTIPQGSVVFAAMASVTSSQPEEVISAAVAIGIPEDRSHPGVIMEGHFHSNKTLAEEKVREMAVIALKDRGYSKFTLDSIAVEHKVSQNGAAIALCLLW